MAKLLEVESTRIIIDRIRCVSDNLITAWVKIDGIADNENARRLVDDQSGLDLYWKLKDSLNERPPSSGLLIAASIDESSFELLSEQRASSADQETKTLFIPNTNPRREYRFIRSFRGSLRKACGSLRSFHGRND